MDSGYTVNLFFKTRLLPGIHNMDKGICVTCNREECYTDEVGTLDGYGDVWMCRGGIANILSLARVSKITPTDLEEGSLKTRRDKDINTLQYQENELLTMNVVKKKKENRWCW